MGIIKKRLLGMVVCAGVLSACATNTHEVKQLKGKSVEDVLALLGNPNRTVREEKDGRLLFSWFNDKVVTSQQWVNTGSTLVGVAPGGNGVGETPLYQNDGYYATRHENRTCDIDIYLNQNYVVVESNTYGSLCEQSIAQWRKQAASNRSVQNNVTQIRELEAKKRALEQKMRQLEAERKQRGL